MASNPSRKMIAALQVSLDGFVQGPNGEKDWVDSWADAIELIPDVDTFLLGGRMYPDYGEYWESIYANPERVVPFEERIPSKSEIAYARLAAKTPHIVLSTTLKSVSWPQRRSSGRSRRSEPSSASQGRTCMSSAGQPLSQAF